MGTKLVNGKRITLSPEEEAESQIRTESFDSTRPLKIELEALEREKVIETLLAPQKAQIDSMSETELKDAIANGGL